MIPLLLIGVVLLTLGEAQTNQPTATTSRGTFIGKRVNYGSNTNSVYYGSADVFLGIPYAQAPLGDLRFRAPRDVSSSSQPYDASYYRPKCPQQNPGGPTSEDCLFLNVYTQQTGNSSSSMAVMMFIDGSNGLTTGGQDDNQLKGTVRNLVSRGVVVVTFQYRLGALGFMNCPSNQMDSNVGMLDQVKALQWVQSEISNFGGDANRVTLCGQGDGACSVAAHTLSPVSQTMFQQAIIQSGTINSCYSSDGTGFNPTTQAQTNTGGPPYNTQNPVQQNPQNVNGGYYGQYPAQTTASSSYVNQPQRDSINSQGGTGYNGANLGYNDGTANPSQQLAQQLCNITAEQWMTGSLGDLHSCLNSYTVDVIVETQGARKSTWWVVRDNYFLPDSIENLQSKRPPIPIIMGTVQDEDADYVIKLVADNSSVSNGQMYNDWLVDFSQKNKLNATQTAQIGNIINQNYNVSGNIGDPSQGANQYNPSAPTPLPSIQYDPGVPYAPMNQGTYSQGTVQQNQNYNPSQYPGNNQATNQYQPNQPNYPNSQPGYQQNQYQYQNNVPQQQPYGQNVNQAGNPGTQYPMGGQQPSYNGQPIYDPTSSGSNQNQNNQYAGAASIYGTSQIGTANEMMGYYGTANNSVDQSQVQTMKMISTISSDSGIMSQTSMEIDTWIQNGNQMVRVYMFSYVSNVGRDSMPNTGDWQPVFKGQDQFFLFMQESEWKNPSQQDIKVADDIGQKWTDFAKSGQVQNWQPTNSQTYNYCDMNTQSTQQQGYAANARQVFNDQVYPIARDEPPRQTTAPIPYNQPFVNYQQNTDNSTTLHVRFTLNNVPMPQTLYG